MRWDPLLTCNSAQKIILQKVVFRPICESWATRVEQQTPPVNGDPRMLWRAERSELFLATQNTVGGQRLAVEYVVCSLIKLNLGIGDRIC